MNRKIISYDELLLWMNDELHKHEDFKDCELTSVTQCEEDEIGCNWTNPNLTGHGVPVDVCNQKAFEIAEQARQLFNVKWS